MTEISEAAKVRACELVNATEGCVYPSGLWVPSSIGQFNSITAFARFIQDVSDVLVHYHGRTQAPQTIARFILPDPVVDPLEDVLRSAGVCRGQIAAIATDLAARGLQIVEASK